MDSPDDLRSAIADLDRRQTRLINQIKHRREQAEEATAQADRLTKECEEVQERWLALIQKLRDIEEDPWA